MYFMIANSQYNNGEIDSMRKEKSHMKYGTITRTGIQYTFEVERDSL